MKRGLYSRLEIRPTVFQKFRPQSHCGQLLLRLRKKLCFQCRRGEHKGKLACGAHILERGEHSWYSGIREIGVVPVKYNIPHIGYRIVVKTHDLKSIRGSFMIGDIPICRIVYIAIEITHIAERQRDRVADPQPA